jgi:hypothetical protein
MSAENNPEMTSLNADDLDAGQLDDQALEEVAGGSCGTFSVSCGTYAPAADKPDV